MPINPDRATFINLDRGEQIVIEKDTDYQWQSKEGNHPITGLKLESGGSCIYYHLENGIWYCSEYEGNSNAIPQLKIKFEASESEMRAREAAKDEWELRRRGNTEPNATTGAMEFPTGSAPSFPMGPDGRTASYGSDHGLNMPEPAATATESGYGLKFPTVPTWPQEPAYNPQTTIDMQQGTWQQSSPGLVHFPSAGLGTEVRAAGEYRHSGGTYDPTQRGNMPELPSPLPSFPAVPTTSPFFPCPSPPSDQVPTPNIPAMPSIYDSGRQMVVNSGDFLHVGGDVGGTSSKNAVSMPGSGATIDWSPDLHQELTGTYNAP